VRACVCARVCVCMYVCSCVCVFVCLHMCVYVLVVCTYDSVGFQLFLTMMSVVHYWVDSPPLCPLSSSLWRKTRSTMQLNLFETAGNDDSSSRDLKICLPLTLGPNTKSCEAQPRCWHADLFDSDTIGPAVHLIPSELLGIYIRKPVHQQYLFQCHINRENQWILRKWSKAHGLPRN